ncbi:protein of unknown function [Candidatus Nitrospira inopinata]|uniref:Uncharacterized protein n=1 Tax=Candidatus Nitrospira inopinata TaxID=1715989 RepID=A0A0S4KLE6_9BACT|nr:protein of unknown function [Candidatus Nitrospira inopinata]
MASIKWCNRKRLTGFLGLCYDVARWCRKTGRSVIISLPVILDTVQGTVAKRQLPRDSCIEQQNNNGPAFSAD